ncbi:MAG: glutamyl-tRNA reductase, partial [Clostridiales bacterium]|nr:glutamyl-tRNA reductase [Clostridiales bacterium]
GLDSMVLGEDEILRQVKEAYLSAKEQGFVNSELNIIFQGAFNCAKQTKSETAISNTPVSIGTLTANMVVSYLEEKELPKKVLVIGATGKIGSIVAKDLISKGISVTGTTRSHIGEGGVMLQGGEGIAWIPFDKRYEELSGVSAMVSATGSPHYTITKDAFEKSCGKAQEYLLVDLAVPYDIDQDLAQLDGVTLCDIDYFENLSSENYNIKLNEIDKAKCILADCVEDVQKKLLIREFQVKQEKAFQEKWFRKMISYLREALDSEQLEMVLTKIVKESKKEDRR